MNKTSHVAVAPSANRTLTHVFSGIPKGSHYTITVSINTDKAQAANVSVSAEPLPIPQQLQVWPEKNGSFVVYWHELNFHDEKFSYEVCVYEGKGLGLPGGELTVLNAKEPPQLIHPTNLGGADASGKIFTVGVRIKTNRVSSTPYDG